MRKLIGLSVVAVLMLGVSWADGPVDAKGFLRAEIEMEVVPHKYKSLYTANPEFIDKIYKLKMADPNVFTTAEIREMLGLPKK